jgi:O-antigen/teichoic acid export membrane protein
LNFGITTYASNQLAILRRRDEMDGFRQLQASTLALLLGMATLGILISTTVFVLPLGTLLHLTTMPLQEVRWTAFLLGAQAVVQIVCGYYNNMFLVVEQVDRGTHWSNLRRLAATLVCLPLAMMQAKFSSLAFWQLAAMIVVTLLTLFDLKRLMAPLPLGLRGADWKTAKASLVPSGFFAMTYTQVFLLFQAPVILLQWMLGPETVVLFSISRTILATARQFLQNITFAIIPEITFSFGERNHKKLLDIFHVSEKIVFSAIPVGNLCAYLFSPVLLALWLHKPEFFDPYLYALMTLISAAMSMREHKQSFHFSTNTHRGYANIVFFGNLLMLALSIPATRTFGLDGFLYVWLISEVTQMGLLYRENKKLLYHDPSITLVAPIKLVLMMLAALPLCAGLLHLTMKHSLWWVGAASAAATCALAILSYFLFGVGDVWERVRQRVQQRRGAQELAAEV